MRSLLSMLLVWTTTFVSGVCCSGQAHNNVTQNPASAADELTPTREMTSKRAAHTATLLDNGKVLIAGGFSGRESSLSTAELFDARAGEFREIAAMVEARVGHTATRLANGKVLLAGGYNGSYLASSELFDPATNRFERAGRMTAPRSGHVATTLNDGRVLLIGGVGTGWTFLSTTEIYDPRTNSFRPTGSMSVPRESHTATLLRDGKVLVTGGHQGRRTAITIYTSSEIYDPSFGTFSKASELTVKRHKHAAVLLNDGRVLVVGGSDERDGAGAYNHAEIYDPQKKVFSPVPAIMTTPRYKFQGTVIPLQNGKIFIAGGADRAETFDPASSRFQPVGGSMQTKRLFAMATLLENGHVLITGGYSDGNAVTEKAWLYRGA